MVLGGMVAMMCMWALGPASCAILWRISMGRVDIPAALALVLDAMAFTRVSRRDLCLLCAYGPWYALNQVMLFCRYHWRFSHWVLYSTSGYYSSSRPLSIILSHKSSWPTGYYSCTTEYNTQPTEG